MTVLRRPLIDRFSEKYVLDEEAGCWLWTGAIDLVGYGRIGEGGHNGRTLLAHRVAYEHAVGPIPDGLTLDHLCRVRHCVNPDHLEAVTMGENVLRGDNPPAANARKTHCIRGHDLTDAVRDKMGRRVCALCVAVRRDEAYRERQRVYARARRARLKAAA